MKRIGDLLRNLRDQATLAGGGGLDRPTSLYQAGAVGGEQRTRVTQAPTKEPTTDEVPARRRPEVTSTQAPVSARTMALRSMLANPRSLRTAVIISEVLGPPVSQRGEHQRYDSQPPSGREPAGQ